uniref:Uncharacterized protein n=1 Tax=Hyaloperonospora arabidopsidis (strain Emoy2) TaxID=559515 RepID=M4BIN1_HYAAE
MHYPAGYTTRLAQDIEDENNGFRSDGFDSTSPPRSTLCFYTASYLAVSLDAAVAASTLFEADINSITLILQCLRCIVLCNLIQFYELNYLYIKGRAPELAPLS